MPRGQAANPALRLKPLLHRIFLTATLSLAAAAIIFLPGPALSDGGAGTVGAGGTDSLTGVGGTGISDSIFGQGGGGGGGAGVTGGNGGNGGANNASIPAGGVGGASAGASGTDGASVPITKGGGGGGGGAHGFVGAALPVGTATGGNGGNGGDSGLGGGGGGGAGGAGAVITGTGNLGTLSVAVTGGSGGRGGIGSGSQDANGGSGGSGLVFTNAGGATFTLNAAVAGGGGGAAAGGIGPRANSGFGITGSNLNIAFGAAATVAAGDMIAINLSGGNNSFAFANATTGITGQIFNAGTLTFAQTAGAVTVGNVIAGGGDIIINGTQAVTFAAINTYTGTTTVASGTLNVGAAGSITSNVSVSAGAALGNNGTVTGSLVVNGGTVGGNGTFVGNANFTGGTLSPGNSVGTLNFQGNLSMTAATTYLVEVNPASADRTNVTGSATLGGATVSAIFAPGSYVTKRYTILNANSLSGTFASLVNTNLPSHFLTALSYDPNNVYLDIALFAPGGGANLNVNQTNVANALTNSFNTAGRIPLVFASLTPQGLTQVSGEAPTGAQQATFNAMNSFMNAMTDPFMAARAGGALKSGATAYSDETMAYAGSPRRSAAAREAHAMMTTKAPSLASSFAQRWSVWGAGYGGSRSTAGNAVIGSNNITSNLYGGAAGLDYRLTADTIVGFALGGAGTNYRLAGDLGNGRSDAFQSGLYGRHKFGASYVAAAFAYGWQDITVDRTVFGNQYRSRFDAGSASGRLEAGHRIVLGSGGFTPYAAGQLTTLFLPAYAEQVVAGVNTFALAYTRKDVTAARSELGLRADTSFALADAVATLRGRAAWAHGFNTERSIGAFFQTLPASDFVVNGASARSETALVSAGGELRWLNGFSLAATFEGEFAKGIESYAGKGVLRYNW
jgi:uncharacterized protein with beta-barrel porin domain